jgi:hypothetical protein
MQPRFRTLAMVLVSTGAIAISPARAEDVKKECVDAATLGQKARDGGKLMVAREQMVRCARDECSVMKSFCARWLTEIEAQIPSVVVRVVDSDGTDRTDAKATMDGRALKLDGKQTSLDPGEHTLVVEVPGAPRREQKVLLVDREKSRLVSIQLPSKGRKSTEGESTTPAASQGGIPTGVWIVGGLGVAALGSAAYFGLTARNQLDHLKNDCSPNCTDAQTKPGRTDALIADVSLGVGVAGVVGALLWAALAPRETSVQRGSVAPFEVRPVAGGWFAGTSFSY